MTSTPARVARTLSMAAIGLGIATATLAQTVPDQQVPSTAGLDLPANLQIFGKQDPNVRKATAIVNQAVITGTDVDQRVAMIVAINKLELRPEDLDRLKLQVLRQLIDESLQIQEAKSNDIKITATEINQAYAGVARGQQRTPQQMADFLRSVGSSEASLKRQIEGELSWNRLLRRKVTPFINVSDEEVQAILDRLKAAQGTEEYNLREIYLSATPDREAQVRAAAQQMIEQMRGGAPFEYFATNFSEASTRAVGGDLGWVKLAMLPPELQEATQQLGVGQIAGPIALPGGMSLLYLVDKRQVLTADPRDTRLALRQLTVKFPEGITQAEATQRAAAFQKATSAIRGCGDVDRVAKELNGEVVNNDAVRVRDLPGQLQDMMLALQVGQASPPFGNPKDGVRSLIVCGRDDPKGGSLPSAEAVQNQIEEQRVNLRAQRMLRDLRRDAIVEYR